MPRINHEDSICTSYVMKAIQMLSKNNKTEGFDRCHLLLSSLKEEAIDRLRLLLDGKNTYFRRKNMVFGKGNVMKP